MDNRLWEYIDGDCTAAEKLFIEQQIATDPVWKEKYGELLEVHALMQGHLELDEPSMRFTQNVMDEIAKYHITPAASTYINKNIIRGIGAFFLCTILGFLVYVLAQFNWSAIGHAGTGGNLPIDVSKVDLSRFDLSKIYNSPYASVFMMVNVVLGLVLLDMYLGRKKKIISKNP